MKRPGVTVALALIAILSVAALHQRAAQACGGTAGALCTVSQSGCLKSLVMAQAIPSVIVAPPAASMSVEVPCNLFITCPPASNCATRCTGDNYPISASAGVTLRQFPCRSSDSAPDAGGILSTTHIGIYETRRVGPDFGLEVLKTPQAVLPGGSAQFVIRVAQVSGASPRVTLAVEGLPPGASGSFSPNPITPITEGGVTTLTIDTIPSLALGSYQLTIVGTGGALRKHRASVTLNVEAAALDFVLLSSVSQVVLATGCDDWIESPTECPVSSADFEITVIGMGSTAQLVPLSVHGLPAGSLSGFSENPVVALPGGRSKSVLTVFASYLSQGNYTVTVIGGSGNLTRSVSFDLIINW